MFGPIDFARPQVTDQQLILAENIQWQKTVMIIVSMKKTAFLLTVNGIIGCIKIQNQFFGHIVE